MGDLRVAHSVLAEVFENDPEPIPEWERGELSKLETCRCCIEVEAFGVRKYPDVASCAAKLFYSTIKMHAFPNGNKRFALVLLLVFLIRNEVRLSVATGVSAETAKRIADSDPRSPEGQPDVMVAELTEFFRQHLVPHEPGEDLGGEQQRT
jgi:death-on-curing family protein